MAKTILVVDDSSMMRKIIIKNIQEAGFTVTTKEGANGQEGLDLFKLGGIDCVRTDWNMPIMDGITLIREIRKLDSGKTASIFMVTTEGSAEKVKEAIMAGASNYLVKPFTPDLLKAKLTKVLA